MPCIQHRGIVLLVEDNARISTLVGEWLGRSGYEVDYAENGLDAHNLAVENTYDAIVLDISLPRMSGLDVCRRIRESVHRDVPVLLLSGHAELSDKLEGLAAGADDYMTKPFFPAELEARITSLIRRRRCQVAPELLEVHGIRIDPQTQQVTRRDEVLNVMPTGVRILSILMRMHPHVVTRRALERELWGSESPETDSLRSHIYALRKALDKGQALRVLQTIPTVGYRLQPAPLPTHGDTRSKTYERSAQR